MQFHRNAWYVAALASEVGRELRRHVLLGEPVLLYRSQGGAPVAILDRCPHRFAPLNRGTLDGDVVQCKYHGLRFDGSGKCVFNPHGGAIGSGMKVTSFPAIERYGLVWIWMGNTDDDDASPDTIPDLTYMEQPDRQTIHNHIETAYRYDILVDNLLDTSHVDYLHVGSFSGGTPQSGETKVKVDGSVVNTMRTIYDAPPPPRFASSVPDKVNQSFEIHWHPGQVITFEWRAAPVDADLATGRVLSRFAHFATPRTADSTGYFMSLTCGSDVDHAELAERSQQQARVVQGEDGPMLDAIHAEMEGTELLDLKPMFLPCDTGAIQVRRVMRRLLDAQAKLPSEPIRTRISRWLRRHQRIKV